MKKLLGGSQRENWVAVSTGVFAMLLLTRSLLHATLPDLAEGLLAVCLVTFLVLADRFPIHVRYATKISMTSVPLFLIAILLPTPLALVTVITGMLATSYLARKERGLLPIDFIQVPARWIIIIFLIGILGQLFSRLNLVDALFLPFAALAMLVTDILTFSVFTSLGINEPFLSLCRDIFQQVFAVEGVQYLIGILGALAYRQAPWSLLLILIPTVIAYIATKNLKEMRRETREVLISLADAVDLRDVYTGGHSRRVAGLVVQTLKYMRIGGAEAELIETAARLHDIGKIDIPDSVLLKSGELLPSERETMQRHTLKGQNLLSRYPDFSRGAQIVQFHHERWDGTGYPNGLKAHEIPFGARLISVADGFDAMTSDRPYRVKKTVDEALRILSEGSGMQWDPEIVTVFVKMINQQNSQTSPVPSRLLKPNPSPLES